MKYFVENKTLAWSVIKKVKLMLFSLIVLYACKQEATADKTIENNTPWKLICIGDGTTAGVGLNPDLAYPALLNKEYLKNGFSGVKIVNAGIKNETIKGIDQRIEWMLQQRFDAILLSLGQGELTRNNKKFWENCFRKIRLSNPEATILVGIISQTQAKSELNTFFSELLKEFDVQLVDLQLPSNQEVNGWWQPNTIYPSEKGHQELANRLFSISQKLNK